MDFVGNIAIYRHDSEMGGRILGQTVRPCENTPFQLQIIQALDLPTVDWPGVPRRRGQQRVAQHFGEVLRVCWVTAGALVFD